MVKIEIRRNEAGAIVGLSLKGHAMTAEHGQDIVCAAISALAQTAIYGLKQHLQKDVRFKVQSGNLQLELLDAPDALTDAILETTVIGFTEIGKTSPQSVRISERRR